MKMFRVLQVMWCSTPLSGRWPLYTIALLAHVGLLHGQNQAVLDKKFGTVHARIGSAIGIQFPGPMANSTVKALPYQKHVGVGVYYQWLIIQDSTLGIVFRKPSGIKYKGRRDYDGDIDVQALRPVLASCEATP